MEWIIVIAVIALLGFWIASIYNQLVALKNRYENGFSQIEIQLKRRYDLIPNLVETAKGYLSHEKETLESVIQARNQAMNGLQSAANNPSDPNAIKELSSHSIIDSLTSLAEDSNSEVTYISVDTEEGSQLMQGFGGLAAILRYPMM